jgi:hypothetical protein
MRSTLLVSGLALILVAGCFSNRQQSHPVIVPAPPEFATAPEQLDFQGEPIVLASYLWRDFMPPNTDPGSGLSANVAVRGVNSSAMTSSLRFRGLFVVNGGRAWVADFKGGVSIPEIVTVHASDGPRGGPDLAVDVVARLQFPDGSMKLIAQRGVPIGATR